MDSLRSNMAKLRGGNKAVQDFVSRLDSSLDYRAPTPGAIDARMRQLEGSDTTYDEELSQEKGMSVIDMTVLGDIRDASMMFNAYQKGGIEAITPKVPSALQDIPYGKTLAALGVIAALAHPTSRRALVKHGMSKVDNLVKSNVLPAYKKDITAYHGSPHKFDKFSSDNIGTGEGAQAYGHGLYFAENKDVAGEYYNALNDARHTDYNGFDKNALAKLTDSNSRARYGVLSELEGQPSVEGFKKHNVDNAIKSASDLFDVQNEQLLKQLDSGSLDDFGKKIVNENIESNKNALAELETLSRDDFNISDNGGLYEVDIPDEHVKNFLDWDAPLSEQPEGVRNALIPIREKIRKSFPSYADNQDITGQGLYDLYRQHRGGTGQFASEGLNEAGIKGIKYFDGSSRGAGEGTRNLVVFDDGIVKTLSRNGESITPTFDELMSQATPDMLKRQSGLELDPNFKANPMVKRDAFEMGSPKSRNKPY